MSGPGEEENTSKPKRYVMSFELGILLLLKSQLAHDLYPIQTYRAEDFRRAAEVYKELSAENPALAGEQNDLRINSRAADAQLQWAGLASLVHNTRPSREDLEAFETTYNVACGAIGRGELETGGVLLKRARG